MPRNKKDQQTLLQFGANIRDIRKKRGWTQAELGEKADMAGNFVGFVERGERSITLKNVVKLQKALRCPFGKLFGNI